MALTVRPETSQNIASIHAVTIAAFRDASHTSHTEHFIVDALRAAGALAVSLVAEADREIVGHVAVSPVSISDGTTRWFGLGPVSVHPSVQRRGIGSRLVREALRTLNERGAAGCVVLGDPHYYSRFGFLPESALVLPDVPAEYFQVLSFGGSAPRGVVAYHGAFGAER